jgi:hypothetical protein
MQYSILDVEDLAFKLQLSQHSPLPGLDINTFQLHPGLRIQADFWDIGLGISLSTKM